MAILDNILNFVLPKKRQRAGGDTVTATYNPQNNQQVLTVPLYRDHITDIFTSRTADDSRTLLKGLFKHDPDVSSAVHGYLTLANTRMTATAQTVDGAIDPEATRKLHLLLLRLTRQTDYSRGFQLKQTFEQLAADLRYMVLLRGGIGGELISDKTQAPDEVRQIDLSSIQWDEKKPGEYKPLQTIAGQTDGKSLDIPTFFVSFYRRDPTEIYAHSPFVSVINTVAARQQVINDLYRIMNVTGFPRLEITVMEEVLLKRAPANIKTDQDKLRSYLQQELTAIAGTFAEIRVDQAVTHSDSVQMKILNEKNPGVAIDITQIIQTLNALNQAALKTMSTLLGRGTSGVNTGSVEARLAAMFADEVNEPLAEFFGKVLSYCLHQDGFQGFAHVRFAKAELRPVTELEPQLLIRSQRLRQDLSDGILSDIEYTLEMYGRLPNPDAPELSGTGFLSQGQDTVDATDVSVNADPLGRSLSPKGGQNAGKADRKKSTTPKNNS